MRGGDLLIIDDPHNPSHINSHKMRKNTIDWLEQTFLTRLNDKNKGSIVLVMQRLHQDDLSGYLLENHKSWQHLKIPIMANRAYNFLIKDKEYRFPEGAVLHNLRDQSDYLINLEQELGFYNYSAQYLQEPVSQGYSLIQNEYLRFYEAVPEKFDYFVQSWDTAIKISENADYSVCTCWGIIDKQYYLIYMLRNKLTYPELKSETQKLAKKYRPRFILIEDKSSGQSLIQDLKLDGFNNIIGIKPKLDKITRFTSIISLFQSGVVFLPKKSPFSSILLTELLSFPHSKNDDIVDSISQFLNFIKDTTLKYKARIREFTRN